MNGQEFKKLNIIGAGRVGKTLARLWHEAGLFAVGDIANRSVESARKAAAFIGAGAAAENIGTLPPADVTMIATPDGRIAEACAALAAMGNLKGHIVFHCSGALPSSILQSAKDCGAFIASIHPVKSFIAAEQSVKTFAGTWCAVEGDKEALAVLVPALQACGANTFPIDPARKAVYHAGNVFVCNYLTALMEAGFRCYEYAGVSRSDAARITQPIVMETIRNIYERGTAEALTGPIARGDKAVVENHLAALRAWNADYASLYQELGGVTESLALEQRMAA
jgi:predicted short-subunit dehydrogenase-like oxidoreductase (DUF2520 family)